MPGDYVCPSCGSDKLSWDSFQLSRTFGDPVAILFLGCDECSETVINRVALDEAVAFLNEQKWRP